MGEYKILKNRHIEIKKLLITAITAVIIVLLVSIPLFIVPDMKKAAGERSDAAQSQSEINAVGTAADPAAGTADDAETSADGTAVTDSTSKASAASSGDTDAAASNAGNADASESDTVTAYEADTSEQSADAWYLRLVDTDHLLPDDFTIETTALDYGIFTEHALENYVYYIDSRCCSALESMITDCVAAGYDPIISSGYRSHETQIELYEGEISVLTASGMSEEEAAVEAGTIVAVPGSSEHELGLALDIASGDNLDLDETQAETETQQWLMENSWKYGFILRYPEDKSDITGIIYEPWHYRYVGAEAAAIMHENNWCLEEYLETLE